MLKEIQRQHIISKKGVGVKRRKGDAKYKKVYEAEKMESRRK